jgi:hypothetical protein
MSVLQNHKNQKRKKASSEKFDQTLSSRRKMRRTLPLGNSQNKRESSNPAIRKNTQILVLVKGDRQMGSQVSPTTQILVLVKGDRRMGSQVSPATQILVLVIGDCRMGSQVSLTTRFWFWLKGIATWDLRLAQPHTGYWFWLKGSPDGISG